MARKKKQGRSKVRRGGRGKVNELYRKFRASALRENGGGTITEAEKLRCRGAAYAAYLKPPIPDEPPPPYPKHRRGRKRRAPQAREKAFSPTSPAKRSDDDGECEEEPTVTDKERGCGNMFPSMGVRSGGA